MNQAERIAKDRRAFERILRCESIETCKTIAALVLESESLAIAPEASAAGKEPAHTDHPLRHWDRTCPACIAEKEPTSSAPESERAADQAEGDSVSATRFIIEGTWSGTTSHLPRVVHRTVHPASFKRLRAWAEKAHALGFTDGTMLHLIVRDCKPRERVQELHGYDSLINLYR